MIALGCVLSFGACGGGGGGTVPGPALVGSLQWVMKAPMPTPRLELGAAAVNGRIYAIGGFSGSTLAIVEEYDPATDTWTRKADMPTARRRPIVVAVNGKIYAIGGVHGNDKGRGTYRNVTEEYDPTTNRWTSKAPFPIEPGPNSIFGNQQIGGAAVGGLIYVIAYTNGGSTADSPTRVYDPATNTWDETKAPAPLHGGYAVASVNNTLYALTPGGTRFAEYDTTADVWFVLPRLSKSRETACLVAADGKLYAIGGVNGPSVITTVSAVATVERFDPSADTWATVASMSTPRYWACACEAGGKIYVIGGATDTMWPPLPLSTVEEATP